MTQRRVTATNQFSTVIDVLQMGKKTGLLTIERGEGETFEEGTITFVNGQVVNAAIGRYTGRDAATKLFSWQACRFSFVPLLPGQVAPGMPATPTEQKKAKDVTQPAQRPFYGSQQTNAAAQDSLSRRPFTSVYSRDSIDNILLTLDRQGFSRTHRRLFLLIDGGRSIRELAALIGRAPDETLALLADLEQAGFIQL